MNWDIDDRVGAWVPHQTCSRSPSRSAVAFIGSIVAWAR